SITLVDGPLQPGSYSLSADDSVTDRAGNALIPYSATFQMEPLGDFLIENLSNNTFANATRFEATIHPAHGRSFARAQGFAATDPAWSETIDLDGDGDLDLVSFGAQIELFLNDGAGNFSPGNTYPLIDDVQDVARGDFDNDGRIDFA